MLLKIVYLLVRRMLGLVVLLLRGDRAKDVELLVLRHENAVLRRQAGQVRYGPADWVWFAALARLIPRRRWADVFPVTPATLLAWHRKLAAKKYDTSKRRKPRPPADGPEHCPPCRSPGEGEPGEGEYAVGAPPDPRRTGETARDGRAVHRVGDPPRRGHRPGAARVRPGGSSFGPRQPGSSQPGFLHVDTVLLKRLYVLVFIEHGTRRMHLGGMTTNPIGESTVQQARNLAMSLDERCADFTFLIRDRGSNFTASFDAVFGSLWYPDPANRRPGSPHERDLRTPRRHPAPRGTRPDADPGRGASVRRPGRISGALQHGQAASRHCTARPRRRS
jgi:putative transposase